MKKLVYGKILVTVEIVEMVIPIICRRGHRPEDTPSVDVVRHFDKSLMQSVRSVDRDKGFEAVRNNSGFCVDKHIGNASPLPCLSLDVALRELLLRRRLEMLQKV